MTDVRDSQVLGKSLEANPADINASQTLGKVLEANPADINASQVLAKVLEANTREIRGSQILGKVLRSVSVWGEVIPSTSFSFTSAATILGLGQIAATTSFSFTTTAGITESPAEPEPEVAPASLRLVWSEEDRYFRGLCVNELFLETPADNITGNNCAVCLYPFAGTIPEVPCTKRLVPNPAHTYRLQTAAPYSLTFDYPEVSISRFPSTSGLYGASISQGIPAPAWPIYNDWVPADELEYTGSGTFNTYDLYWNPASTWQTNLINEYTMPKVGDFLIPRKDYIIEGAYTVRCHWSKRFILPPVIRRLNVAGTLPLHTTVSPWHTPAAPHYSYHSGIHITQAEFVDVLYPEIVLIIKSDAVEDTELGWSTARHRVEVYYEYRHISWRGIPSWEIIRAYGNKITRTPNWTWGPTVLAGNFPRWAFNVFVTPMYPYARIAAVYRWESFDLTEFMTTEDFTCARVEFGNPPSYPRIDDPLGPKYGDKRMTIKGPAYNTADGTYRFYATGPNTNYYPPSSNWIYDWAVSHLVNSPSSVVVSRLDLTGGSGS